MLSPTQKDALAIAFFAGLRVPRSLHNLATLVKKDDFASAAVSAETMWKVVAELYYRKAPTDAQMEKLKALVMMQPHKKSIISCILGYKWNILKGNELLETKIVSEENQ